MRERVKTRAAQQDTQPASPQLPSWLHRARLASPRSHSAHSTHLTQPRHPTNTCWRLQLGEIRGRGWGIFYNKGTTRRQNKQTPVENKEAKADVDEWRGGRIPANGSEECCALGWLWVDTPSLLNLRTRGRVWVLGCSYLLLHLTGFCYLVTASGLFFMLWGHRLVCFKKIWEMKP